MAEKERVNKCRNEFMQKAVDSIAQMAPAEYAAEIEKYQQLKLASFAIKKCVQKPRTAAANADQFEIRCLGCDKFFIRNIALLVWKINRAEFL